MVCALVHDCRRRTNARACEAWDNEGLATTSRGDSLDLGGLQASARQLAGELRAVRPRSAWWDRPAHLRRLDREARVLEQAYRAVADDVRRAEAASPAAEWLLDNFHLIANEVRSIHHDLPRGYYRRLPKVRRDGGRSVARIEVMATDVIRHSDGRLDAERLRGYVVAYQSVSPLTIGELWAWPSLLKAGLISYVSELAEEHPPRARRGGERRCLPGRARRARVVVVAPPARDRKQLPVRGAPAAAHPRVRPACGLGAQRPRGLARRPADDAGGRDPRRRAA